MIELAPRLSGRFVSISRFLVQLFMLRTLLLNRCSVFICLSTRTSMTDLAVQELAMIRSTSQLQHPTLFMSQTSPLPSMTALLIQPSILFYPLFVIFPAQCSPYDVISGVAHRLPP